MVDYFNIGLGGSFLLFRVLLALFNRICFIFCRIVIYKYLFSFLASNTSISTGQGRTRSKINIHWPCGLCNILKDTFHATVDFQSDLKRHRRDTSLIRLMATTNAKDSSRNMEQLPVPAVVEAKKTDSTRQLENQSKTSSNQSLPIYYSRHRSQMLYRPSSTWTLNTTTMKKSRNRKWKRK